MIGASVSDMHAAPFDCEGVSYRLRRAFDGIRRHAAQAGWNGYLDYSLASADRSDPSRCPRPCEVVRRLVAKFSTALHRATSSLIGVDPPFDRIAS
jgi:hypothetical protein